MGNKQISKMRTISVATLNYSGIMNCPFQFYCKEHQQDLEKLSKHFNDLIPQYMHELNSKGPNKNEDTGQKRKKEQKLNKQNQEQSPIKKDKNQIQQKLIHRNSQPKSYNQQSQQKIINQNSQQNELAQKKQPKQVKKQIQIVRKFDQTFKWQIGNIDKKIRTGRYSPMFQAKVGVQDGKFILQQRFKQLWDQAFDRECMKNNFNLDQQNTKQFLIQKQKKRKDKKDKVQVLVQAKKQQVQAKITNQDKETAETKKKQQIQKHTEKKQQTTERDPKIQKIKKKNLTNQQENQIKQKSRVNRNDAKIFDLIMYHACLRLVFEQENTQIKIKRIGDAQASQFKVSKYIQRLMPFYELSFLDQKKKCDILTQNLFIIDAQIFFFQEYSFQLKQKIEQSHKYFIKCDSKNDIMIIAKKNYFKRQFDFQTILPQLQKPKQQQGICIMVVDNLILIGCHLSSKKVKNQKQINQLKQYLYKIKTNAIGYEIILGGDLNSFMGKYVQSDYDPNYIEKKSNKSKQKNQQPKRDQPPKLDSRLDNFNIYPLSKGQYTTVKKRTKAQCQYNKGDQQVSQSKDKIITTLPFVEGRTMIRMINGAKPNYPIAKNNENKKAIAAEPQIQLENGSKLIDKNAELDQKKAVDMLPSDSHPFDHYIVYAELQLRLN